MTKPRRRPAQRYIAFLVEPEDGFSPSGWQDIPKNYRVVEFIGPKQFRGRADAWRFLENRAALENAEQGIKRWAVVID